MKNNEQKIIKAMAKLDEALLTNIQHVIGENELEASIMLFGLARIYALDLLKLEKVAAQAQEAQNA